jgi:choline dehydrogenase-like flavoprotein
MGSQKIAVVGTGANGASIGADLTRAGLDVTFIEQWPAHVEAMRKGGIRIEMPDETLVTPVRAFHVCEVATLREAFDIVLIVVKAYDTRWACELIKPLVKPDGLVVGVRRPGVDVRRAALVDLLPEGSPRRPSSRRSRPNTDGGQKRTLPRSCLPAMIVACPRPQRLPESRSGARFETSPVLAHRVI